MKNEAKKREILNYLNSNFSKAISCVFSFVHNSSFVIRKLKNIGIVVSLCVRIRFFNFAIVKEGRNIIHLVAQNLTLQVVKQDENVIFPG